MITCTPSTLSTMPDGAHSTSSGHRVQVLAGSHALKQVPDAQRDHGLSGFFMITSDWPESYEERVSFGEAARLSFLVVFSARSSMDQHEQEFINQLPGKPVIVSL